MRPNKNLKGGENLEQLINLSVTYGIFAVLFIWLLHTTNTRNEDRENQYQQTIKKNQEIIAQQAQAFSNMTIDLREIKNGLKRKGSI